MTKQGTGLLTRFASPERDQMDVVEAMAQELADDPLIKWFDTLPMPMVVINEHRQILFCNKPFCTLSLKAECAVVGLRPGEALDCVHAKEMEAGCGCSKYCNACGAAQAIIKSLDGEDGCEECRMLRLESGATVPLDLLVFTRQVEFRSRPLTVFYALDISHEKRLAYLNRTFHHSMVNGVGGINALTEILDTEEDNAAVLELLNEASRRTLKTVLYHRDLEAAEKGRLAVDKETFDIGPFLSELIDEECRLRNTHTNCAQVETSCAKMHTDKRILGHVLGNMLENALEARDEASVKIRLSCSPVGEGKVAISMSNPGTIPPDIRKQMFKRYVSTKSRDRGLGTYAMKLFTEQYLGGEVAFTSGNKETTFVITLPVEGE